MQPVQKTKKTVNNITILFAIAVALTTLNFLFISLTTNEAKTSQLLKKELVTLEQEARIIAAAQDISTTYKDEIEAISAVFPTEETIPIFIGVLEDTIRSFADEYSLKFTAVSPIKEDEKLFLPVQITMKSDLPRLVGFFTKLEKLPYMMHVTSINGKTPEGLTNAGEMSISLKVYVQNPFITK